MIYPLISLHKEPQNVMGNIWLYDELLLKLQMTRLIKFLSIYQASVQ
jgi:hypothetical protein